MNKSTNKCISKVKSFDQFQQGVSLRISKQYENLPSWIGLFCTIFVTIISIYYLAIRFSVLANYYGTSVNVVETEDALPQGSAFNFTIG
jgi:hypothetical protein